MKLFQCQKLSTNWVAGVPSKRTNKVTICWTVEYYECLLTCIGSSGLVLHLDPHVKQSQLAKDHNYGSRKDDKAEPLSVPPKDADQVWYDQDEWDEWWEAVGCTRLHHCHCLHDVAKTGTKDHSYQIKSDWWWWICRLDSSINSDTYLGQLYLQ